MIIYSSLCLPFIDKKCNHHTLLSKLTLIAMEENKHSLLQPLLPFFNSPSSSPNSTSTTTASSSDSLHHHDDDDDHDTCNTTTTKVTTISNTSIILRLLSVLFVSLISIWANYEASKTFHVTILNDDKDSLAGRRFALSYVSNDKATRIILNTSSFVEHLLYPNNNELHCTKKKHIDTVTLRLPRHNLNATTATVSSTERFSGYYVIDISHTLLENNEEYNNHIAIVGAVQRAMARVWLYDGRSSAPPGLVDGMAEYVAELAGFRRERVSGGCDGHHRGWWVEKDARVVARYLHYCEGYKKGFIQRLNEALKDTWHDRMVDDVLGMPAMELCGLYNNASSPNLI
ncbi:hypothetical protein RIF29_05110 [Crotalaria pallida]|uniref:Uncharacterized protein n=1 Tax=Crotalaria pallida TaxID=3830 RepID=A0AAN9PAR8_CROPI